MSTATGHEYFEAQEDALFLANIAEMKRLFPDVKCDICIRFGKLDQVVSSFDHIILRQDKTCFCHDEHPVPDVFVEVKKPGGNITYRDILNRLNEIHFTVTCPHYYLEGIRPTKKSMKRFNMVFWY
jgi:hypothetical protein